MGQTNMHKYMPRLLSAIEEGKIDPTFVISHRLNLSEAPMAYDRFNTDKDTWRKVVLKP
jgi:threonine dehydrogenase-like Zn-dependent dehydrogenase